MQSIEKDQSSKRNVWAKSQKNSDHILSSGLALLCQAISNEFEAVKSTKPGVYLFSTKENRDQKTWLYIGESKDLQQRTQSHCRTYKNSTFVKNYAVHEFQSKSDTFLKQIMNRSRTDVYLQFVEITLGRKELEEFGMVNLPTILNRFNTKKRNQTGIFYKNTKLWQAIQENTPRLLAEGYQHFESLNYIHWSDARVPSLPGIYSVMSNNDDLIYIGQTTNLKERYDTHSRRTYFSALRKNIGRTVLGSSFIAPKKFAPDVDILIDGYIEQCKFGYLPVSVGRLEFEEYLIQNKSPILNRKV